jgi:hypothetical protein
LFFLLLLLLRFWRRWLSIFTLSSNIRIPPRRFPSSKSSRKSPWICWWPQIFWIAKK